MDLGGNMSHRMHFGREPMGPGVKWLIGITAAVFVVHHLVGFRAGAEPTLIFGLSREGLLERAQVWQLVTHLFLHAGFLHAFFNMVILGFVGRDLERVIGTRRFVWLYLGCGMLGGLCWLAVSGAGATVCIGASGAVFGIVAAFVAFDPQRGVTVQFGAATLTVKLFTVVLVFGLATLLFMLVDRGNIAHAAHLAGGAAGFVYGRYFFRRALAGAASRPRREPTPAWPRGFDEDDDGPLAHLLEADDESDPVNTADVDRILEKISRTGIGSLTRQERRILDAASRRQH